MSDNNYRPIAVYNDVMVEGVVYASLEAGIPIHSSSVLAKGYCI